MFSISLLIFSVFFIYCPNESGRVLSWVVGINFGQLSGTEAMVDLQTHELVIMNALIAKRDVLSKMRCFSVSTVSPPQTRNNVSSLVMLFLFIANN